MDIGYLKISQTRRSLEALGWRSLSSVMAPLQRLEKEQKWQSIHIIGWIRVGHHLFEIKTQRIWSQRHWTNPHLMRISQRKLAIQNHLRNLNRSPSLNLTKSNRPVVAIINVWPRQWVRIFSSPIPLATGKDMRHRTAQGPIDPLIQREPHPMLETSQLREGPLIHHQLRVTSKKIPPHCPHTTLFNQIHAHLTLIQHRRKTSTQKGLLQPITDRYPNDVRIIGQDRKVQKTLRKNDLLLYLIHQFSSQKCQKPKVLVWYMDRPLLRNHQHHPIRRNQNTRLRPREENCRKDHAQYQRT